MKELYAPCPVTISDKHKQEIDLFAADNNIELNKYFYYLGNLAKRTNILGGITGSPFYCEGTDEEKEKHHLICDKAKLIEQYNDSIKYLSAIDSKIFISLALCNIGTDFDEDIDIKIYIQKGYICSPENLPFPGNAIIGISIGAYESIYVPKKTVNIGTYPNYFVKPRLPSIPSLPQELKGGKSYEEKIKEKISEFIDKREEIFCYKFFSDVEQDILCYNQRYLKQNTNTSLPSYLVFNKVPDKLKYEITSKRFPNVIQGELIIEQNNL